MFKAKYCYIYVDINECETSGHNCSQTCTNTPGSYTCSCRTGYEDNGYGNCTGKTTLLKQFCNIAVCFVEQWKPFSSILSNHSILCTITVIKKDSVHRIRFLWETITC